MTRQEMREAVVKTVNEQLVAARIAYVLIVLEPVTESDEDIGAGLHSNIPKEILPEVLMNTLEAVHASN